jgi:hypothetical protein
MWVLCVDVDQAPQDVDHCSGPPRISALLQDEFEGARRARFLARLRDLVAGF